MNLLDIKDIDVRKPIIFCFIGGSAMGHWLQVTALSQDGYVLGGHISSTEGFAKFDISNTYKWEKYSHHYPFGYQLVWVGIDEQTPQLLTTALELNKTIHGEELSS